MNYSETNQNLTACIVCRDSRWKEWGKLLSNRFNKVFVISSANSYEEFILESLSLDDITQQPESITVAFIHETDQDLIKNFTTKFNYIFKFTSSGTPTITKPAITEPELPITGQELPIYRKNFHNSEDKNNSDVLGVKSNDIEEVVAYITKRRDKEPSMCFPTLESYESLEANTIEKRKQYLSELSSLLKHYKEKNKDYYQSIYQLIGTSNPIVYIFDDYNNYIDKSEDGIYTTKPHIEPYIADYYCKYKETLNQDFNEILKGFCLILNNLSLSFTIKVATLNFSSDKKNYELICSILPLTEIDQKRSQIAAFIVDLEWLPTPQKNYSENEDNQGKQEWKKMGCYAIDILSQRYPEIPSFIFTGLQPSEEIQEALTYGASWGFQKEKTHHYSPTKATEQQLNYINLEQQLVRAINVRYGSYQTIPFPNQFKLDSNTIPIRQLRNKFGIKQLEDGNFKTKALQKLIAKLFPRAELIEPVKVLTAGKSQAQATFFVSPRNQEDQLATRFIKIGSWFSIHKEYLAYQKIIQPRLNSYTANIIQKPILTEGDAGEMPWGALMYSLAGFPEDYNNLKSMHELFEQYMEKIGGDIFLLERLLNTLENVLLPFYQSGISKPIISKQPLVYWLSDFLPPLYTGVLIPITSTPLEIIDQIVDEITLLSLTQPNTNEDRWELTSRKPLTVKELNSKLQSQREDCDKNSIPEPSDKDNSILKKPNEKILLSNWYLSGVEWQESETEKDSIILVHHPQLGIRILLRGESEDIRLRFGATWIRPNMLVKVLVCLDSQNKEFKKIEQKIKENFSIVDALPVDNSFFQLQDVNYLLQVFQKTNQLKGQLLKSPFDAFGINSSLLDEEIEGREGSIHGDLNLNNILYPANETVGWLIDFERVKEQGMIAFDLAKLEVEIWSHHLSPYIGALATLSSSDRTTICYQLLYFCLQALEFPGDEAEFFKTKVKQVLPIVSDSLLIPISNSLKVIKAIRRFGLERCKLSNNELKWALAGYFFNSAKFDSQTKKFETFGTYSNIFAFIASAWHLGLAIPHNYN